MASGMPARTATSPAAGVVAVGVEVCPCERHRRRQERKAGECRARIQRSDGDRGSEDRDEDDAESGNGTGEVVGRNRHPGRQGERERDLRGASASPGRLPRPRQRNADRKEQAREEPVPRLARKRRGVRPGIDREMAVRARKATGGSEGNLPGLHSDSRHRQHERRPPSGRGECDQRGDRRRGEHAEPDPYRESEHVQVRTERGREAPGEVILAHDAGDRHGRRQHGERLCAPERAGANGAAGRTDACQHPPAIPVGHDRRDLAQVGEPPVARRLEKRAQHLLAAFCAVFGGVGRERGAVGALGGGHDAPVAGCRRRTTTSAAARSRAASSATTRSPSPVIR